MNLLTLFGKSRTASVGSMQQTKPSDDTLPLPIKYNGNAPKEWADKIEYVFTSGTVHFFRFISEPYIPYTRANAALDIYEELEWGISPAFLQKHIQAVDSVLTDPKNKTKEQLLAKLAVLNSQFKERMNLATNLTLRMKLATVLYFDETEDITTYNYQKGVEKVAHWTNHHDVPDFFLKLPILNFLPSLNGWEASLETLIRAEAINQIQMLEAVTMLDISDETNPELRNLLGLQREIYQTLRNWKK